eukprot:GHVU01077382.1.p2 GENE.GHVU01077382.1~~GHVU01077382.1.p2  ORF type:complete len:105 (+),score=5.84 GHVU01077382.1:496-810(+)
MCVDAAASIGYRPSDRTSSRSGVPVPELSPSLEQCEGLPRREGTSLREGGTDGRREGSLPTRKHVHTSINADTSTLPRTPTHTHTYEGPSPRASPRPPARFPRR